MTVDLSPAAEKLLRLIEALPVGRADAPDPIDEPRSPSGAPPDGGASTQFAHEHDAIRLCLRSSRALLTVAFELQAGSARRMSVLERQAHFKHLLEQAKIAGRGAYRVALVVSGLDLGDESKDVLLRQAREERERILPASGNPA